MKQLCPKCANSTFQLADIDIEGSIYSFTSVQCKHCGFPSGVINYENIPATVIKKGNEILTKLSQIERKLKP